MPYKLSFHEIFDICVSCEVQQFQGGTCEVYDFHQANHMGRICSKTILSCVNVMEVSPSCVILIPSCLSWLAEEASPSRLNLIHHVSFWKSYDRRCRTEIGVYHKRAFHYDTKRPTYTYVCHGHNELWKHFLDILQILKINFRGVPWCHGHKESFGNISWIYCIFEKSLSVVFRGVMDTRSVFETFPGHITDLKN